jgi:zinc transporter ZupT
LVIVADQPGLTACGFPLISSHSRSRRSNSIVFYSQHFGTGVLIATAFVHLLPTAFQSLTDPCLPYFFSKGYKPLPGFIAMFSAMVVVAIESYLTTRGARHSHSHMWEGDESDDEHAAHPGPSGGILAARRGLNRPTNIALEDLGASEGLMAGASPLPESTPTLQINGKSNGEADESRGGRARDDDDDDVDRESMDLELNMDELSTVPLDGGNSRSLMKPGSSSNMPTVPHMPNPEEQRRLMLQCLLLEAGILFHSVFIGMAISVATGPPFVVFLVAIAFHQTFEGLALGSRIAGLHLPKLSYRPWLMVLAYGTTTPIGQAIGLIVHNFYDPMSQTGLLMVGFMNAISSGLLLFAGLVQLLAEDFLTDKSYKTLHGRRRVNAFVAVVGGALLMALVGAFA